MELYHGGLIGCLIEMLGIFVGNKIISEDKGITDDINDSIGKLEENTEYQFY